MKRRQVFLLGGLHVFVRFVVGSFRDGIDRGEEIQDLAFVAREAERRRDCHK